TLETGSYRPGPPSDKGCFPRRQALGGSRNRLIFRLNFQKRRGLADCTCGNARTLVTTDSGNSPSISIKATALPPGASRATWNVAMLIPSSPKVDENLPIKPGLSRLVM